MGGQQDPLRAWVRAKDSLQRLQTTRQLARGSSSTWQSA